MPDLENNKVDIDTSGPAMDVDIAEEKDSAEIEQPEVKEEPTVRAVEEETTSEVETKTEENVSEEKTEEPKKDELQDYSDSVQKRIAKLTKKWREAERQKDEALTYAKSVLTEKQKAEQKLSPTTSTQRRSDCCPRCPSKPWLPLGAVLSGQPVRSQKE